MTEAVILALIALAEILLFATTVVILVAIVLRYKPASFKFFWTKHGHFEVNFDNRVDE